jgi:hypothetical protein
MLGKALGQSIVWTDAEVCLRCREIVLAEDSLETRRADALLGAIDDEMPTLSQVLSAKSAELGHSVSVSSSAQTETCTIPACCRDCS